MQTLRIAPFVFAMMLAVGVNSTALGFMTVESEQPAGIDDGLSDMVDSLRDEMQAGETSCQDMLAKLDAALEKIDAKLDQGVPDEEEYLAARDEITDMRYDLECVADKLTQISGGSGPSILSRGGFSGGGGFPSSRRSGGGGGGGAGGGGGLGGLIPIAAIGGGIAAAANDDSTPGFVASQSAAN